MKLKSIRMNGFKSFADKTEIAINTPITAIVGPNGSGKSNIVDAIRWVLGSQSVKSLRGTNSMTDVIFAGSETRSPLKRAEVTLVFDNSTHFLNTELNDVEIKRVLYSTSESEYYLNNQKVRLRDITDILLDSGIDSDSLDIISQGSIESIVESKPEDRRVILESAAQVLKYKTRKEESLHKLEKTKDNLEKVSLVTDELYQNVEPLRVQSEKAHKYVALKQELKDLEIALSTYDITDLKNKREELEREIKQLSEEKENDERENQVTDSKTEKIKIEIMKLDSLLEEEQQRYLEYNALLTKLESEKTLILERQKYEVDTSKIDEDVIHIKSKELNLEKELKILESDTEKQNSLLKTSYQKLGEKEEEERYLTIKVMHAKQEKEECSSHIYELENQIRILESNLESDSTLPYAVKNILNNPRLHGIHNIIGKIIDVPEKYETAISVSLGASSNFIVVDDSKSAEEGIHYLKENKMGRATFFPLTVIEKRSIPNNLLNDLYQVHGYLGIAADLIQYQNIYEDVVRNQLGNVIVAQDMLAMNELSSLTHYQYRIVTLDGELTHAGGSITGGSLKKEYSSIKDKIDYQNKKQELVLMKEKNSHLEQTITDLTGQVEEKHQSVFTLTNDYIKEKRIVEEMEDKVSKLKEQMSEFALQLENAGSIKKGSFESRLVALMKESVSYASLKEISEKKLSDYHQKKSEYSSLVSSIEQEVREKNSAFHKLEQELKKSEIELGKMDTKLDYLLTLLSDQYHLTYEKAFMDYTIDMDISLAREKVMRLRKEIELLGEVNVGSIEEYERVSTRYNFLMKQKTDLEHSMNDLLEVIREMDEIMVTKLKTSFAEIEREFALTFKKMFKGGTGKLVLTDPDHILESGIEIIAEPPGKKLNSIQLLSGGEKTLTAISLLFAILNVNPVPFCILDEVEAALDEANVDTFGSYLQEQKEKSEFIIITHKKRTMEYASTLYGITMQEQGVSKIVSVKLES